MSIIEVTFENQNKAYNYLKKILNIKHALVEI